jgi:signal transduction histidine kinase
MAKKKKQAPISTIVQGQSNKARVMIIVAAVVAFVVVAGGFYLLLGQQDVGQMLLLLGVATVALVVLTAVSISAIGSASTQTEKAAVALFENEMGDLRTSARQGQALQAMAAVLRSTLNFERVVDEALTIYRQTMIDAGASEQGFTGAVFLFRGKLLYPIASRRLLNADLTRSTLGQAGLLADAFAKAETAVSYTPANDPELSQYIAFQKAKLVLVIPLRAGFQIFGAMVLGVGQPVKLNKKQLEFLDAIADQAVIALQNAQLFERLDAEKQRLIDADSQARKELARDLHDGPTQTIAAIAMRVNFIRSLMSRDVEQATVELQKVEELAKKTAKEIRGMLFSLRPLVLETQGLSAAIETVMKRIKETDGLNMRLVGGENGDLIKESAQTVVFAIVEEALGNARKHSKAELVEVRFWKEEDLFVVRIQDNGVGFDVQEVNRDYSSRGSLGMINLQERAEQIDGSIKIESKAGKGTMVTLVVPLATQGR